jgi:hypothetical protein
MRGGKLGEAEGFNRISRVLDVTAVKRGRMC